MKHTVTTTCRGADIFNIASIEVDDMDGLGWIRMQLISVSLVEIRFRWISGLLGVTSFYRTVFKWLATDLEACTVNHIIIEPTADLAEAYTVNNFTFTMLCQSFCS